MKEEHPADPAWWQTTLFRLSGVENVPIRRLIAGNPDLPREGFLALMDDQETDVLRLLSRNPSLPIDLALRLLSHDYSNDFIDTDWVDVLIAAPNLSADDLCQIMEEASWEGIRG
ncbi:hypothetical protein [Deinococcus sp. SL84]|uniref:hypothetical protein n=1 Tax=Deinococcus sp. SL84 TaxID=2994663 RepID=UPI00227327C8|nr:hypothetical protein [Deinococcus sp. SL84]MCY1704285.1 hypothetical protein [Deinococcus sp. SL84]